MTITKSVTAEFKLRKDADDQPTGEVEFYAAKFGNVDLVGDRMVKGSFAQTLEDWRAKGAPIPVIFSHKWDDPFALIGEADPNNVVEDDNGLLVKATLDINDNPLAMQVWKNMARKTLNEASFAYDVVQESGLKKGRDGANDIFQVDLLEVGPTLKGANPETVGVLSAKSAGTKLRPTARKDAPMEGSVEAGQQSVLAAVNCYFASMPGADPDDFYVSPYATFSDHLIVSVMDFTDYSSPSRYFNFPYTVDDQGEVQLGAPTEVEVSTQVSLAAGKSDEPDGAKAAAATDADGNDKGETLFDLSDAAHAAIAAAIVFGAQDVRNGKPLDQSKWTYRGSNPGADLNVTQVATVVSRVRAAAAKFDIPLTAPEKSDDSHQTKAGARHSSADMKSIQAIHDAAHSLGAECAAPKSAGPDGTKDAPGDQSEGDDNEDPEDASSDDEATSDDNSDGGTESEDSEGDEQDDESEDGGSKSAPVRDFSLDLLELEAFTL
jgi:HK97 family phage prohead protease